MNRKTTLPLLVLVAFSLALIALLFLLQRQELKQTSVSRVYNGLINKQFWLKSHADQAWIAGVKNCLALDKVNSKDICTSGIQHISVQMTETEYCHPAIVYFPKTAFFFLSKERFVFSTKPIPDLAELIQHPPKYFLDAAIPPTGKISGEFRKYVEGEQVSVVENNCSAFFAYRIGVE